MKKFFKVGAAMLLAAAMILSTAACGKGGNEGGSGNYDDEIDLAVTPYKYTPDSVQALTEGHMTERPSYALAEGAGVEEQRKMAIQAMWDELTFKWTTTKGFTYQKSGAAEGKIFEFTPQVKYAGVPYTNAALGIFHALEFYDYSNGLFYGAEVMTSMNSEFGNSCAACVNWAEAAVCPGMCAVNTYEVTPYYGYVAIGYDFPEIQQKFNEGCTTEMVVNDNGAEKMYESLAQALPADALITQGSSVCGDHCMMVYTAPKVVRGADGKIDPKQSTLTIIDQWSKDYSYELDGENVSLRGRLDKEFDFDYLTSNHFILMRPAEFEENKAYEVATATLKKGSANIAELRKDKVLTNYRTVKLEGDIISESGKTVYIKKNLTDRSMYNARQDRSIDAKTVVPGKDALDVMKSGRSYTYRLKALLATGDEIVVCEFPITEEDIK